MTAAERSDSDGAVFQPRSGTSWRDPFTMYSQLRDREPLHHVEHGDYWVLSRFEDVFAAARDPRRFSSAEGLTFTYGEREKLAMDFSPLVMLDPPEHTAFRRLVSGSFTPRRVGDIEEAVRDFVRERVDRLAHDGGGDLVEALAKPLPSFVVAHYLGVPPADRVRFDRWTDAIVGAAARGDATGATEAVAEISGYFLDLVERRRSEPGDDLVSALAAAQRNGEAVPALEILGFAFTMITGGNDTVTGLVSVGSEILTAHPDQREMLASDPSTIPLAVEELLRLASPVQGLARTTTTDVALHGGVVPAGKKVLLLYGSANRDEREFGADAASFSPMRDPARILAFGSGNHFCLGAAAARLQARVAFEELLSRSPGYTVDADAGRFADGHFVRRYTHLPVSV